jgi:hypothetical protein
VLVQESLTTHWERGVLPGVVCCLEAIAHLIADDQPGLALSLLMTADQQRRMLGYPMPPIEHPAREQTHQRARSLLSEAAMANSSYADDVSSLEEAIDIVLAAMNGSQI